MLKSKKVFVYIFFVVFTVSANFCYSQISCFANESVRFEIPNWISNSEKIQNISFTVQSSNPTVFFIDSIKINDLISVEMKRSYWEIKCSTNDLNLENIDLIIYGTGLNSADTVTEIQITDIIFDENTAEDFSITAVSKSQHTVVKFAKILNIYSLPLKVNEDLHIDFLIDISQDISFTVADLNGKIVEKFEIKNAEIGRRTFKINFGNSISFGVYRIFLETNTGNDSQLFLRAN